MQPNWQKRCRLIIAAREPSTPIEGERVGSDSLAITDGVQALICDFLKPRCWPTGRGSRPTRSLGLLSRNGFVH
jgi:hypothetical protein